MYWHFRCGCVWKLVGQMFLLCLQALTDDEKMKVGLQQAAIIEMVFSAFHSKKGGNTFAP